MKPSHLALIAVLLLSAVLPAGHFVFAQTAAPGAALVMQENQPVLQAAAAPAASTALTTSSATHTVTISGAAFAPTKSDLTFSNLGGSIYPTVVLPGWGLKKWLDLPDGATLTSVTFYFVDNASGAINLEVQRFDPLAGATEQLASASTAALANSSAVRNLTAPMNSNVNTGQYAYAIRAEFTTATDQVRLVGARITYTIPTTYLPSLGR